MKFQVWYMRPEFFRDGIMGMSWLEKRKMVPNTNELQATHRFLMDIEAEAPEDVFGMMQGERWSPNGEGRDLIRSKGLQHTSMSMGDILVEQSSKLAFIVDRVGLHCLGVVP